MVVEDHKFLKLNVMVKVAIYKGGEMKDIKNFLKIKPENLAEEQYIALVDYACNRLQMVINHLENGSMDEAEKMLEFSPAGDGYGCDNHFIRFEISTEKECCDIFAVIEQLRKLNIQRKGEGNE